MTTNFLSGILAVILALTSFCGGFVASGTDHPATAEFGIELDGDLSMLTASIGSDQSADAVGVITKLLSALTIRLSADASVGQMQVKLNGSPVASLSVQKLEDGWAAVSDLFPSTKLTVKNESLAAAIPAEGNPLSMLSGIDVTALTGTVVSHLTPVLEALTAKLGEPETGSFTVGGVEYTQKMPVNLTTREALELILTAAKDILSDETVAGLVSQLGQDLSPESVENTLEELRSQDESELPVLSAATYANEAGETATEILLEKDGQAISFLAAVSGKKANVTLDVLGQLNGSLVLDTESNHYQWDLAVVSGGTAMNINGSLKTQGDVSDFETVLSMPVGEPPLRLKVRAQITQEAPVFEAAESLRELAAEGLAQDEEAAASFNTEVMQSLMTLMVKVSQDFPELMTLMVPQTPQVEEAPAEEAPAA